MSDREAFRKGIEEYLKRGRISRDLFADKLSYTREHVSRILHGKAKIPEGFERHAVLVLAELGCIRGKGQARDLLQVMDLEFSLADWNESPLATLSDTVSSNLAIAEEAASQTQGISGFSIDNREEQTIKCALGKAIQRYATSDFRLEISRPFVGKKSSLDLPAIVTELSQLIRSERAPDAKLIGEYWKKAIAHPPIRCDFTAEAQRLLDYFQSELRSTEVFRPVFDSKSLDAIEASTATSTEALADIETQLADLAQLLDTRFSDLSRSFAEASFTLHEQIRDYTRFIQEKTHDFVGRQFVFDAVTHFTDTQPHGYYFIRGDPGIGKSALAAQMVRTNGYVHHFNIRSEGINKTETFLRNICAQLIVAYQLNHPSLPPETTQDAGFLNRLLGEVSDKLGPDEKAVIVIDALDEVDTLGLSRGTNALYLPITLPQGIYVIITTRKISIDMRIDCVWETLDVEHDSEGNIADIREYVERVASRPGIQAYIATQGIDNELFIDHLVEKSEGNFMYLHYVLPEIEHGYYKDLGLEALPAGLQNYYEDHWRRMRGQDEESWFQYKLPVVMALTVVEEPVAIDLIADFANVRERARIREVLREWSQFLHEELIPYEGSLQKRYHVYHASLHDFIAKKEEVEDERVSRIDAHKKIADNLWSELYGDEKP